MATERLKFKLELYATMWHRPPHVEVSINEELKIKQDITGTKEKPDVLEFDHELSENEKYELKILRQGKNPNQTIVNEKGDILKDQLLHIKSIEIDEINIGTLVYEGIYTPVYPEPWASQQKQAGNDLAENFKNAVDMGFNGTWIFTFKSPFYLWLLENLY